MFSLSVCVGSPRGPGSPAAIQRHIKLTGNSNSNARANGCLSVRVNVQRTGGLFGRRPPIPHIIEAMMDGWVFGKGKIYCK